MVSAMYGAIIGDVVGSRFEFDRGGKTTDFDFFTPECEFTDDTVMTIAVADALMSGEKDLKESLINSMKKWGAKFPYAGYGSRFSRWLFGTKSEPYGSFGNGSAMRVSAAAYFGDTVEDVREIARMTAEVTHNHPEGIKGAECTAAVMKLGLDGFTKEEIKTYVRNEFGYRIYCDIDKLRSKHKHNESCQDTLPKALSAYFAGDSFLDVVSIAVSLGGDTDTIGAIAGSMAETIYIVPEFAKEIVRMYLPKDIIRVLDDLNERLKDI